MSSLELDSRRRSIGQGSISSMFHFLIPNLHVIWILNNLVLRFHLFPTSLLLNKTINYTDS